MPQIISCFCAGARTCSECCGCGGGNACARRRLVRGARRCNVFSWVTSLSVCTALCPIHLLTSAPNLFVCIRTFAHICSEHLRLYPFMVVQDTGGSLYVVYLFTDTHGCSGQWFSCFHARLCWTRVISIRAWLCCAGDALYLYMFVLDRGSFVFLLV